MTSMTVQYFEYQKDLEKRYGEHSVVFWMCGTFYEVYGIYPGKDKVCNKLDVPKSINQQLGNLEDISKILGIAMTKRAKERPLTIDNPYMCGFPAIAVSKHLAKLLQYQYTVAIYDQFDSTDPRKEKERRLQKIYSPSTYISDDHDTNNILLCCNFESFMCPITHSNRLYCAAAHIDLATGHSASYEFYDDDDHPNQVIQEIYKLLYCNNPSEIIIINQSETLKSVKDTEGSQIDNFIIDLQNDLTEQMVHVLPKQTKFWDPIYQEEFLKKIFKQHKQDISLIDLIGFSSGDAVACFIQLLQFTYEHDEHIIDRISFPTINKSTEILYLNQDALYCLNLLPSSGSIDNQLKYRQNRSMDSCFSIMNKTKTKMGERLLKYRISHPITNYEKLNDRYDMIDRAKPHHRNYTDALKYIIDIDKKYRQTVLGRIKLHEFNELYKSFAKSIDIFHMNNNIFEIPQDKLHTAKKMVKFITDHFNTEVTHEMKDTEKPPQYFKQGVFKDIDKLYNRISEITGLIKKFDTDINMFGSNNNIRASINITIDKQGQCILSTTKRAYEALQKIAETSDWNCKINYSGSPKPLMFKLSDMRVDSVVNQHVRLRSSLLDKFAKILEKDKVMIETESNRIFNMLMKKFITHYNDIIVYISHKIAEIDVAVCCAIVSIENYYNRPILTQGKRGSFEIIGLRHPIIEKIATETEYITNNVSLDSKNIGVLLYGLNSSGKSSLLRAIGINIILAQAGMFCSCDAITLSCYESLFTKISANDNLFKGQSTFVAEMCCLKDMLQQSTTKSLILCDELTAGTETNSATGIVAASIMSFIQKILILYLPRICIV